MAEVSADGDFLNFACPHAGCGVAIQVHRLQVHCAIFRCGVLRRSGRQIDPHLPREACEALARGGEIYGCGRPFRLVPLEGGGAAHRVEVCDYI